MLLRFVAPKLSRFFDVRPGEATRVGMMAALLFFLLAANNVIKVVRDSLFLSRFPITQLPYVYLLAALVAAAVILGYSRFTAKLPFSRVVLVSLAAMSSNVILFWLLVNFYGAGWVFYAYYIWSAIVGMILVAQFWTLANEMFTLRDSKRLFGLITAGGTLGGMAGGVTANWAVTYLFGTYQLLWFAAALLAAAYGVARLALQQHARLVSYNAREFAKLDRLPDGWGSLSPRLPDSGKPGDSQFDRLRNRDKEKINQVFTASLKIIAAYQRKIVSGQSPFNRFVAGERQALSESAQRGFRHFLRFGCDRCHNTPLFSDDDFHNLGLSSVAAPDNGRFDGLPIAKSSPFRGTGPYADGAPVVAVDNYRPGKSLIGAFRTPSLRELKYTAPYGHNGSVKTLEDWMEHYVDVTAKKTPDFIGTLDPSLTRVEMTEIEKQELVEFLVSLSSDYRSSWTLNPEDNRLSQRHQGKSQ